MKWRLTLIAVFVFALVAAWLGYSKVRQARREAFYRTALLSYQRDLKNGMAREDLEKYLSLRHAKYNVASYGKGDLTYVIEIGEEDSLICEWHVYVALEISPVNTLSEVHVRKIGTCL